MGNIFKSIGKALGKVTTELDPTRKGSVVGGTLRKAVPTFAPVLDMAGAAGKALKGGGGGGSGPAPYGTTAPTSGAPTGVTALGPAATPGTTAAGKAPWWKLPWVYLSGGVLLLVALLVFGRKR